MHVAVHTSCTLSAGVSCGDTCVVFRESIIWDLLMVRARPGIGTLSPRPTLTLCTGEAPYLAPSARSDRPCAVHVYSPRARSTFGDFGLRLPLPCRRHQWLHYKAPLYTITIMKKSKYQLVPRAYWTFIGTALSAVRTAGSAITDLRPPGPPGGHHWSGHRVRAHADARRRSAGHSRGWSPCPRLRHRRLPDASLLLSALTVGLVSGAAG